MNTKTRLLIINYHYVLPNGRSTFSGLQGVRVDDFAQHLINLKDKFNSPRTVMLPLTQENAESDLNFLITFDDGIQEISDHVLPLLKKNKLTAIIFCCSQPYLENRVLNVQKTHLLQGRWGWQRFQNKFEAALDTIKQPWNYEDQSCLGLSRMYRYDNPETSRFKRKLNVEIPYPVVDKVLDLLFEAEFGAQEPIAKKLYLSTDAIRRCVDSGITIGVHTHSHCMLSRLNVEEQRKELSLCISYFQDHLGIEITTISYPYGILGSWNEQTKKLVKASGLSAGLTLGRQIYNPREHMDPFEIPRYDVNDIFTPDGKVRDGTII